jgi:hypothetical protein
MSMVFLEPSNAGLIMEQTSSISRGRKYKGSPNEEIRKSGVLDLKRAMRYFKNINERMLKNVCRVMYVKWDSNTGQTNINAAIKQIRVRVKFVLP